MGLKDLKSDLSKFRNPFKPKPVSQQVNKQHSDKFSTTPLANRLTPDVNKLNASKDKRGTDIVGKNPTGRHTKGTDVDNSSTPSGRHTSGKDVLSTSELTGRHTEGTNVSNNVPISGKLTEGTDVANNSNISGRHTNGKDVENNSNISGRHTEGKDVTNDSVISGRHETDNSNKNIDGNPIGGNPAGRHDNGDTSIHNIDGTVPFTNPRDRHDQGDTSNFNIDGTVPLTNPKDRHDQGDTSIHNIDGNPIPTNPGGRHDNVDTSIHNIDGTPLPTNPGGRHDNVDTSIHNIDGTPTPSQLTGRHDGPDTSIHNIDGNVPLTNPRDRHNVSPTTVTDVNYINDIHASGFTSNFQPGTPTQYNIGSSQLQTPNIGQTAVNFIPDSSAGATGFTVKQENTQFLGIDGINYTYPTNVKGGRLMNVGASKLDAQLGQGTFVPNAGQVVGHPVTVQLSGAGFSTERPYSSVVSKLKASSLGLQYSVSNSPSFFDVLYNTANLRDASPQYGWIDHPLILRGIQRKNNSDTQRWGSGAHGFDSGLIRGGMATALDRTAIDTARIAKFMASPKGLMWVLKNVGLGLTNPKVETSIFTPGPLGRQTRIHTGLASLLSVAGGTFGLHFTRHGIPFANEVADYSNVQRVKAIASGIGNFALIQGPSRNRLINLRYGRGINVGNVIVPLSGLAGPGSVYGIGNTIIHQFDDTEKAFKTLQEDKIKSIGPYEFDGLLKYDDKTQYADTISNSPHKTKSRNSFTKTTLDDVENAGISGNVDKATVNAIKSGPFKDKYPYIDKPINPTSNPTATSTNTDINGNIITGIKAYSALSHKQITRNSVIRGEGITTPMDFRNDLPDGVNSSGRSSQAGKAIGKSENDLSYAKKTIDIDKGMGKQGAVDTPGRPIIRTDYTQTSVRKDGSVNTGNTYEGDIAPFRGDIVNMIDARIPTQNDKGQGQVDYKNIYELLGDSDTQLDKDFVRFYFTGPKQMKGTTKNDVLVFRATMGNISDSFTPGWNGTQILGRADAVHTYNTWSRNFSFDFKVQATSRDEMKPLWRKLNYLSSWTAPRYSSGLMRGSYIRFTMGNLFQETPCFINSLTISVDSDTPWEINLENDADMLQLPHGVSVSMGLTMLMDYRPQWNGRMYSLSQRGRVGADTQRNWLHDSSVEKPIKKGSVEEKIEEDASKQDNE